MVLTHVFLSWSGELSRQIANKVKPWLESVHHGLEAFHSDESIDKGIPWFGAVSDALAKSKFGLLILTRGNLDSAWLLFEAGALSKQLDQSRVHPILFQVELKELTGPLGQFQATTFNKEEMWRLLLSLNSSLGESATEPARLRTTFNQSWPKLSREVQQILASFPDTKTIPTLTDHLGISFESASSLLHELHRQIEGKFQPEIVLTMSGPGSFAACYCMSLNSRNTPVLMAATFPLGGVISDAHQAFRSAAKEALWVQVATSKWDVYIPDVLWEYPKGTKVLILDDRVVTGDTQERVKGLLQDGGFDVRCAAMLATKHPASHHLDFFGRVTEDEYYLPWGSKRGRKS